jgi:ElaA protein
MNPLRFACLPFDQLTVPEYHSIMMLRQEVFVVEQNCPYLDADDKDRLSWHLSGWTPDGQLACYARLLAPGISYPEYASIGRVVSAPFCRRTGAGKLLMAEAVSLSALLFGPGPIKISAQTYLLEFYWSFGFVSTGEQYLEDGLPHTAMIRPMP